MHVQEPSGEERDRLGERVVNHLLEAQRDQHPRTVGREHRQLIVRRVAGRCRVKGSVEGDDNPSRLVVDPLPHKARDTERSPMGRNPLSRPIPPLVAAVIPIDGGLSKPILQTIEAKHGDVTPSTLGCRTRRNERTSFGGRPSIGSPRSPGHHCIQRVARLLPGPRTSIRASSPDEKNMRPSLRTYLFYSTPRNRVEILLACEFKISRESAEQV